ncbi:hypothetical protein DLE60_19305 [Micromonospora globispora]|uniref:Uncharacterized protein n=1 Tax=Micromonospora globispora TaxID=1450148 RepID=A0A317JY81_9ACTN|nr:hypothetical protein DLJ46_20445 [Micromonospora globispora]PWU58889.1 hypothetical protein DLE60_19305 [Micromonospora globispora]RQW84618.1 hypothetical protein DKL51_29685 [Micromonospora globispora]
MVMAQVAANLSLRSRPALPCPPPDSAQSWVLADGGRAVRQKQQILGVHLRGLDGMCVGCRAWWARLTPYRCWQVEWAARRQARAITARFLGVGA